MTKLIDQPNFIKNALVVALTVHLNMWDLQGYPDIFNRVPTLPNFAVPPLAKLFSKAVFAKLDTFLQFDVCPAIAGFALLFSHITISDESKVTSTTTCNKSYILT